MLSATNDAVSYDLKRPFARICRARDLGVHPDSICDTFERLEEAKRAPVPTDFLLSQIIEQRALGLTIVHVQNERAGAAQ